MNTEVIDVEDVSPRIKRIRLAGQALVGLDFEPGSKVKLRLNGSMRSYTPATWDPAAGWVDLLFFLHGSGPGNDWAEVATKGTDVQVFGPKSSLPPCHRPVSWAMFVGDETTLGPALALLNALPPECTKLGAIELDRVDTTCVAQLGLPLTPVIRTSERGEALLEWLDDLQLPDGDGVVWISGHHGSVGRLEQALAARGLPASSVHTKSYWNRPKDRLR